MDFVTGLPAAGLFFQVTDTVRAYFLRTVAGVEDRAKATDTVRTHFLRNGCMGAKSV